MTLSLTVFNWVLMHTQFLVRVCVCVFMCVCKCARVCIFWMCPGQSTQDYHSFIPHPSPGPDPFKQLFIFLWESLHPSLSISLLFYLYFAPSLSLPRSHTLASMAPPSSWGAIEGEMWREMMLSSSTLCLFHQEYILLQNSTKTHPS